MLFNLHFPCAKIVLEKKILINNLRLENKLNDYENL